MNALEASTAEPGMGYQRWLREDGDSSDELGTDKDESEMAVKWVEEAGAQPALGCRCTPCASGRGRKSLQCSIFPSRLQSPLQKVVSFACDSREEPHEMTNRQ